jgi:thimet oligopeptidase
MLGRAFRAQRVGFLVFVLALLGIGRAQDLLATQRPVWNNKPDIAAFEKMETDRLAKAQIAVDQIAAVKGERTIGNTLAPYDEAIRQLNAASNLSSVMQQVHPDTAFRDHATAMTTRVGVAVTALSLNQTVYRALASLDVSQADSATRYYVQRQLLEFHLAGVNTDDTTQKRLKELNAKLTDELSMFDRNISDDQAVVEVSDASQLDGLPPDYIAKHKPGPDGKIRITTNYPDFYPILTYAKSEELRRRLYLAFANRAYPRNRDVLRDMMQTRFDIATLLGYRSWADYNAADKMIVTGKNIATFLEQLNTVTRPLAERDLAVLLAEKQKTDPRAKSMEMYDSGYYTELVRRSRYNFDSQALRPYFAYDGVEQGVMNTAATLFHVAFLRETNAPGWDPSVETWDVFDNGKAIGRFYLDMHPRPGKYSHGEMAPLLDGIRGKQLPEAVLVCNFPQTTATDPGLMSYGDVVTFFHEFGHLMHHILGGQQAWAGISGITMEPDFFEAPSQMLEEWMHSPQVLASFARDYQTGKPIPAELVERMNRASAFGRARTAVAFQIAMAQISYDVYKERPQNVDLDKVYFEDLGRSSVYVPMPGTHPYASFTHLGGYSSMYYTYLWDKVISEDFFREFDQKNLLGGETPMRYRRSVLEPGGSMSANDLVRNFLGRPQDMKAFQKWLGEEFETAPSNAEALK